MISVSGATLTLLAVNMLPIPASLAPCPVVADQVRNAPWARYDPEATVGSVARDSSGETGSTVTTDTSVARALVIDERPSAFCDPALTDAGRIHTMIAPPRAYAAPLPQPATPPIGPAPGGTATPRPTSGPPLPTSPPVAPFELLGQLGSFGQFNAVAAEGTTAWIGKGRTVEVIDASDPLRLVLIGASPILPAPVKDVALHGDVIYVALGPEGVGILERGSAPSLRSVYDTPGDAQHLLLDAHRDGQRLYVADGLGGVRILDVSEPFAPQLLGAYDTWRASRMSAVDGDLLVVSEIDAFDVGVTTVDIADPAQPRELAFYRTLGGAGGIALRGGRALLASGAFLRDLDVRDPRQPVQRGMFPPRPAGVGVVTEPSPALIWRGDVAYAALWARGLRVYDVRNPAQPTILLSIDTLGTAVDLSLAGDSLWLADGAAGVHLYDVSNPRSPQAQGVYGGSVGKPVSIGATDGRVVVGNDTSGSTTTDAVTVVDVRVPEAPFPVGGEAQPGLPVDIALSGTYALVASSATNSRCESALPGQCGLHIVDVADPTDPRGVGGAALDYMGRAVVADGRFAYLATGRGLHRVGGRLVTALPALRVIDIDKPLRPAERGAAEDLVDPQDVVLDAERQLVIVADGTGGLRIVDVANPRSPRAQGVLGLDAGETAMAVAHDVEPNRVWLAGNGFIRLVDVADPWRPTVIGTTRVGGTIQALAHDGGLVLAGVTGGEAERGVWAYSHDGVGGALPAARWPEMPINDLDHRAGVTYATSSDGAVVLLQLQNTTDVTATPTLLPPAPTASPTGGPPAGASPTAIPTATRAAPSSSPMPSPSATPPTAGTPSVRDPAFVVLPWLIR